MSAPRTLVIFAKAARAGRVKTRLARDLGVIAATAWYRRESRRLIQSLAADPRWRTVLAVTPDAGAAPGAVEARAWPRMRDARGGAALARIAQGRGDLGARMGRVLRTAPPGPVVIVGADIPDMTRAHIWSAFQMLGASDAVIGPAEDGGYWLIGLKRAPRRAPAGLFTHVRWSTAQARADTEASLRPLRIAYAATLRDVDTAHDLRAVSAAGGASSPHAL